ncbi:MAG TPA: MAE_28990/MAE_18760 family HEPN-like nuclease [Candidatus Acidoferrales bacterium]|jgi:hypothetical protein|nr:MAE_28990/MAE_18760 family HEPN-like nuclease [Candidatus Acidoferrales bacterium]
MFSHLTSQLESEVQTTLKALTISEAMRDVLISRLGFLSSLEEQVPAGADETVQTVYTLRQLVASVPDKLDWQVYDHCAAVTRIYAAYERFVGDLVGEYIRMLPNLYGKYADLPPSVTKQHRRGIGHILSKLGESGLYKNLEEAVVVAQLAGGLSGAAGYTLLTEAFFIDRQNLRLQVLERLFVSLGFENVGQSIEKHPAILDFISKERTEGSSAQKELEAFVLYRNEAAHKKVENVLSKDEIGAIGRFICALGFALANLVKHEIYRRRFELNQYSVVCTISEIHHGGMTVIGIPGNGVDLKMGDEIIIWGKKTCRDARIESIQLDGNDVAETVGDGAREIGLRLNTKAPKAGELRRLAVPAAAPKEIQLELVDAIPAAGDVAESDLMEAAEDPANPTGPEESDV